MIVTNLTLPYNYLKAQSCEIIKRVIAFSFRGTPGAIMLDDGGRCHKDRHRNKE